MNLYLIDGNSYVYRAFYAIRGLTNSRGRPTSAIFGFTSMLLKLLRERKPDAIAVSFDSPLLTERHILFEDYKAHRPETPNELRQQMPFVKEMLSAFNINVLEVSGYEADDVLATVAEKASRQGMDVFIVTGDKDMLQLIDDSIKVYDPMKGVVFEKEYVKERFGVFPERVTEFMALTGDAADNIPGVKGIGEKIAKELLSEFKSLDELIAHPERIKKQRIRKLIEDNIDLIKLSRRLSEIDRFVPVDIELKDMSLREPDWQAVLRLFKEFEFTSLMSLIPGGPSPSRQYETISTLSHLKDFVDAIKKELALSIETQGKGTEPDEIIGLSVLTEKGTPAYIPLMHSYEGVIEQIKKEDAFSVLKPIIENRAIEKTGHDLKRIVRILKKQGIRVQGVLYDVMVCAYLLNPLPMLRDYSLESLSLEELSIKKRTFMEVVGKKGFDNVPIHLARDYSCENVELSLKLKEIFSKKLKEEGLDNLYLKIEMPLIYVLSEMEETGLRVDTKILKSLSEELSEELSAIKKRIYFLSGEEFNINSPRQLGRVLFDVLGLKPGKKKKTGYSTEMSVLEELSKTHELPKEILNWRSFFKLKSTYVDALPLLINPATGRLHTSFEQTATATGRLSSKEPNLQNIPVRGHWGKRIREAFVAEEGNIIISADYSQIELRVMAHMSGDSLLISAFQRDIDVHSETASQIFGISSNEVTEDMRRVAKTVNFGIIYGITPFGLSEALGISKEEAEIYIKQYFERHSGVRAYIEKAIDKARENGYVKTLFGRKRPVPELKSKNALTRQFGERLAINAPIQGTAADIIKIAMVKIFNRLWDLERFKRGHCPLILQVHDELLFESPEEQKDGLIKIVKEEMEGVCKMKPYLISVPLKVEISSGRNWAECQ
ncbi:MAG: DNA polymerase I [Nitrospirae bacterium]|nr:DNA polymerase I [Nitrospirota bacterium]